MLLCLLLHPVGWISVCFPRKTFTGFSFKFHPPNFATSFWKLEGYQGLMTPHISGLISAELSLNSDLRHRRNSRTKKSNQDIQESSILWYDTPLHMLKHVTLFGRQSRLDETSLYIFSNSKIVLWCKLYKCFSLYLTLRLLMSYIYIWSS